MAKRILLILVSIAALAASSVLASQSVFESRGLIEMNKLNKDALFL